MEQAAQGPTAEWWIAVIAAAAAIVSAFIAAYGQIWSTSYQERIRRRREVVALLGKYREPLVSAAYDLQSRLYNIVRGRFLEVYYEDASDEDRFYAETSTLWILGQFLGWNEILRREIQFLDLGDAGRNQRLQGLLTTITKMLASDAPEMERPFRIFRADQRAIGEVMIVERTGDDGMRRSDCIGYAEFCTRLRSPNFARWFEPWVEGIRGYTAAPAGEESARRQRLVFLQRALVDLIEFLDEDRSRFPLDTRGKLPLDLVRPVSAPPTPPVGLASPPEGARCARFYFTGDPWPVIDEWARQSDYQRDRASEDESEREFVQTVTFPGTGAKVLVRYAGGALEIFSWLTMSPPARFALSLPREVPVPNAPKRVSMARRDALDATNLLLQEFDRPTIR